MDDDGQQFLDRVECLSQSRPELEFPQWGDDVLCEYCARCVLADSFAELRSAPFVEILKSKLTGLQLAALERKAPEKLTVPSGNQISLDYHPGKSPVLAVRIQEIFGLRGNSANRRWACAGFAASAGPQLSAAANYRRFGELLANDLSPGA